MPAVALLLILEVVTQTLPDAVVGKNYLAKLQAKGGVAPYTWAIQQATPGGLPAGLTLNPATGEITGVPRSATELRFTVAVTDSGSPPATVYWNLTLRVAQPIVLVTRALPQAQSGTRYQVQLQARGGRLPLRWETEGIIPPGLRLDPGTGLLAGVPTEGGEFNFAIRLSDSSTPPQRETYNFVARFLSPLAVRWKDAPHVERGGIFGSLEAANGTEQNFDLTVIVVAVNEIGKAFTLGYHRIALTKGTASRELQFGFTLPRGPYAVHADAVAEVPPQTIYRARLQQAALRVEDSR